MTQIAIAIPVRNEARRLPRLLKALALAAGQVRLPVHTVILANNCTDASVAVARGFRDPAMQITVHQVTFPGPEASAGRARRMAMDLAIDLAGPTGTLLMTTDADAVPHPDWIRAAAQAGADVVCGQISARVPHVLATRSGARITRAERAYGAQQHLIRHCLDQIAGRQPLGGPCAHYVESGASLAIRGDCYRAIGGLPALDHSEDRALVHRAECHGLSVHYATGMRARVSARLQGRADGGMAACLRHRMQDQNPLADQAMLLPATLADLWARMMAGAPAPYPDRTFHPAQQLRASDLEARLAEMTDLYRDVVRPGFDAWLASQDLRAAG